MRTTVLVPTLRRSLLALRKASPRAYGWGRTRWRGAPLAAPRTATRGLTVSAETMRRWVPEGGWVWQRATLGAKDDDPPRVARLARSRFVSDQWPRGEALGFADALDIPLWPQVGDTWMPPGRQLQVMTPGAKAKPSLAGALDLATGTWHHTLGPRTTTALFRDWLQAREDASPVAQSQPSDVVVDHDQIHQAKAVEAWVAKPPRRRLLFFPTYGPQTTPLERAFGDAQDLCTRKHTRQRGLDLVADVVEPLHGNGPWRDQRSALYDDPVVTAAVKRLALENTLAAAGEVSQSYVDRFRGFSGMEPLRTTRGRLFGKYVVFFVTLVGAVLLASGLIELYFTYQEHKTTLLRLQREKALAAAAKIEQFLEEIERQIDWTTRALWDARAVATEEWQLGDLQLLRQVPAITEISYLDASGKEQLRVSRLDLDEVGSQADFSREAAFLGAKTGKIYFSPVYFHEESEPYMTLAKAGSGVQAGASVAEVNLKFIWEVVAQIKIGRAGYAYAVDSRGQLIAHPNISLVLRKTDLSSLPQIQAALAGLPGPDEGRDEAAIAGDREGRQVLTAYATIVPLGWSVLVEQPLGEAFAPVYGAMLRTAALLMIGLALAVLASLVLARKMVTPIRKLQEGAARIGVGALDHRIEIRTGDELEALADQFNGMAGRLQASYANLEQEVEERTRELREVLEALQIRSRELARSVEELQALGEVSQAINSTLDLQTVLTRIVSHAVQLSEADLGVIYEYDDQHEAFLLRATYQMDEDLIEAVQANPIRLGEGAAGRAAAVHKPIQISDITQELTYPERLRELLSQSGFHALLAVPLLREEHIVGALVVARKSPGEFPPEVVKLLQTFATQSVLAIQNARLFREIDEKGHQLEAASRYKSAFLASMSHELRTPMNAIIGFARLVMRRSKDVLPPRQYENLAKILISADHLLTLLNDVLDLSKIEAGKMELSPNAYAVPDIVETVRSSLRSLAAEKGLEFAAGTQTELPMAFGDAKRLTQCLMNLAGNALKFTRQGRVEIWVERQGEALVYRVSDTGIGIPQDQLESIFAEFRQADSTITHEFGGTGLGLSITKKFVEMHGGRIWVESEVGKGPTFFLRFPCALRMENRPER